MTSKEFTEWYWQWEHTHGLAHIEVKGMKPWLHKRSDWYGKLSMIAGVHHQAHHENRSLKDRIAASHVFINSSIRHNPYSKPGNREVLILDHERKLNVNGKPADIYTHYLIEAYQKQGVNYEVIERPVINEHKTLPDPRRTHLDFVTIEGRIKSGFAKVHFSEETNRKLTAAEKDLEKLTNKDLGFATYFRRAATDLEGRYKAALRLLTYKRPEKVVMVHHMAYTAFVKAARELNIPTYELQHGNMGKYHLCYGWPHGGGAEYFPDYFLSWGKFWTKDAQMPINESHCVPCGFAHFNELTRKYKGTPKEKVITVLSQGSLGNDLAAYVRKNIEAIKDFKIYYKMHPGEFVAWHTYPDLVWLKENEYVEVVTTQHNLYDLLARSQYAIGVYSTAVYESIGFGCQPVLANISGIEMMEDLIQEYTLPVLTLDKPVALPTYEPSNIPTDDIFCPLDYSILM